MIQRVLMTAIIAGFIAGVFATAAQSVKVIPLILEAETYETGTEEAHGHGEESHGAVAAETMAETEAQDHHHGGEEWAPEDGLERTAFTLLSNIATGVGFGLLLCGAIVLRGREEDIKTGVLWGLAGFATFSLFPAIGLPPELPGTVAAEVDSRQLWWFLTVGCSGVGLSFIFLKQGHIWTGLGIVLIAVPHVVGAPHPEVPGGNVPPALAAEFAVASLVSALLFWMALGASTGWLYNRFGKSS